ncbi:MAG: hypothetical protein IPO81_18430 [Kouleothrix sp.]|nr:hypothetical protein [Kouleothrix sp.]
MTSCALPRDCMPRSNTDSAVILAAYLAWGEACVERLIGDFAFVIWDGDRRRVFAARDISGARQLFYYRDRERLLIASDRTQLFQDPSIPFEVDEDQLVEFLTPAYQWTSGWDQGIFQNVYVLDAGCTLRAERGAVVARRFWEWRDREPDRRPAGEVIEQYLHTLEEAVRCRLRSRAPRVAVELSGGLDSPAIAALAARLSGGSAPELHALSMIFDQFPEVDERQRMQAVLDRYPLVPHFLVADELYRPIYFEPDWAPRSLLAPHEITGVLAGLAMEQMAAQLGCGVVLTGQMGDSVNGGSAWVYFGLLRRGDIRELWRRLRIDWGRSRRRTALGLLLHGLLPLGPLPVLRLGLLAQEYRNGMYTTLPEFLSGNLRDRIRDIDRAIRIRRVGNVQSRCPAVRTTLAEIILPMGACTVPSSLPLDYRHPYTDRRLVEMVLAMPQELKREAEEPNAWKAGRLHHRQAMEGIVPEAVRVANPGVDFTPAVRRNLSPAAMREWLLSESRIHIFERGYVLPDRFVNAIAQSATSQYYVSIMVCVEAWLRALAPGGRMHELIPARRRPTDGPAAALYSAVAPI